MTKFVKKLKSKAKKIDDSLDTYLPKSDDLPEKLNKAMRYSVMAGGKRIRPIIVMESAKLFGLDCEKVLPTACGVEMIHTYSLIHDDLPVMDDDDFRRGKPTCHKVFGDAIALLAGDALLTHAFLTISKNAYIDDISYKATIDVIQKISMAAGCFGMVGGQTVDIEFTEKDINRDLLNYINEKKTGALFKVSVWSGARLANADGKDLEVMAKYGEKLGIIFQIVDDILDIKGDEQLLGKPVGSDQKNVKMTFPSLYGYQNSIKYVNKLSQEAKQLVSNYQENNFFIDLVDFIVNRQY